jgi:hypothetical protein
LTTPPKIGGANHCPRFSAQRRAALANAVGVLVKLAARQRIVNPGRPAKLAEHRADVVTLWSAGREWGRPSANHPLGAWQPVKPA